MVCRNSLHFQPLSLGHAFLSPGRTGACPVRLRNSQLVPGLGNRPPRADLGWFSRSGSDRRGGLLKRGTTSRRCTSANRSGAGTAGGCRPIMRLGSWCVWRWHVLLRRHQSSGRLGSSQATAARRVSTTLVCRRTKTSLLELRVLLGKRRRKVGSRVSQYRGSIDSVWLTANIGVVLNVHARWWCQDPTIPFRDRGGWQQAGSSCCGFVQPVSRRLGLTMSGWGSIWPWVDA